MNKTALIIVGVLFISAIIGGIVYLNRNIDEVAINVPATSNTNTTGNTNTNTGANTNVDTAQVGSPIVVTKPNVSPSGTTAVVDGNINPKGALTNYWYEYGLSPNSLGSRTANQIVGSGFVLISAPDYIVGLSKNTLYYFRLVGENKFGRAAGVAYTFKTTEGLLAPVGSIPTVKTIAATGISKNTVNLNGEVIPNKAVTQYWFEYGKTADLGNTSAFSSAGDGSVKESVSISLPDLTTGTTYYFRLNAQNQFGTINGAILNFKTKPASGN